MTEIEKMFGNAGVEKRMTCFFECSRKTCSVVCEHFEKLDMSYPPFTAEKQLRLIEWFISYRWWLNLKSLDKKLDFSLDFDEKLAKLVNRLWESFDDQEKEEIRKILNENS